MDDDKTKQKKKRPSSISYRPPVSLQQELDLRVKRSGLSMSAFLTKSWYGKLLPRQIRRPPIEAKILTKMIVQLADIYDELKENNRLLREMGDKHLDRNNKDKDEIASVLNELRNVFMNALGRRL